MHFKTYSDGLGSGAMAEGRQSFCHFHFLGFGARGNCLPVNGRSFWRKRSNSFETELIAVSGMYNSIYSNFYIANCTQLSTFPGTVQSVIWLLARLQERSRRKNAQKLYL